MLQAMYRSLAAERPDCAQHSRADEGDAERGEREGRRQRENRHGQIREQGKKAKAFWMHIEDEDVLSESSSDEDEEEEEEGVRRGRGGRGRRDTCRTSH